MEARILRINDNIVSVEKLISNVLYSVPGLFEDPPEMRHVSSEPSTSKALPESEVPMNNDDDDFGFDCPLPSPGGDSSVGSRPGTPMNNAGPSTAADGAPSALADAEFVAPADPSEPATDANVAVQHEPAEETLAGEQTTLLQNEEESFALAPVNASALKGTK